MRFIFILLLFNDYNKLSTVKSQGYFGFSWSKIKGILFYYGRKSRDYGKNFAWHQISGTKLVSKGNHDIVVEVDDLLTGKNDVAIKEVKITRHE
jgi:hypothetical protein